jgi:hypothetical protein
VDRLSVANTDIKRITANDISLQKMTERDFINKQSSTLADTDLKRVVVNYIEAIHKNRNR